MRKLRFGEPLTLFCLFCGSSCEMMSHRGIFERGVGRKRRNLRLGVDGAAHFVCFFVRVAARGIRGILILLMEEGRA